MKTINKIMLLFAAAVFTFTACEKEPQRDPSPAGNPNAIAFKQSVISVEINPAKAELAYDITVGRSNSEAELTVNIAAAGDVDVIKAPTSVTFAAGESEKIIKLTFPTAQVDSTYSILLSIPEDNQSPYAAGAAECSFTVIIAAWEPAATQAIVFDGIVNVFYSTGNPGWYVSYLRKDNTDGSFDIRLLNPYTVLPDYRDGNVDDPIQDQFGLYKGFPSNYPEDVDSKGTYNMDIHVDANDSATFDMFDMGMAWSYGEFFGAHADSRGMGVYDKTTNTITFAGGTVACAMSGYNDGAFYLGSEDLVIYLDAQAYQNDHLSIEDYNDPSIEWEEVESVVNLFESTIFNFSDDAQKLYKAVDQYPGNPKSPFINLYGLKDVYSEGAVLAFYWDGEDGAIEIPAEQETHLSFMKQELIIAQAAGTVTTTDVKGTAVKVFSFDLVIVTDQGNEVGEFIETFSMADEAIVFAKEDFIGNFTLGGADPWSGAAIDENVEIKEENDKLFILGVTYADSIFCDFDAETGILSIAPQKLDTIYGAYDINLVTDSEDDEATIDLVFGLSGVAKIAPSSEATGFYLVSNVAGGAVSGMLNLTLTPAPVPAGAPAIAPAINGGREFKQTVVRHNIPSVEHLVIKGKYHSSAKTFKGQAIAL